MGLRIVGAVGACELRGICCAWRAEEAAGTDKDTVVTGVGGAIVARGTHLALCCSSLIAVAAWSAGDGHSSAVWAEMSHRTQAASSKMLPGWLGSVHA